MDLIFKLNTESKQGKQRVKIRSMKGILIFLRDMLLVVPTLPASWKKPSKGFPEVNVSVSRCSVKSETCRARRGLAGLLSLIFSHFTDEETETQRS